MFVAATFATPAFTASALVVVSSASRLGGIGFPAIAFMFVPAIPGGVMIMAVDVAVAGISIVSRVSRPDGVTGGVIVTGIVKP